MLKDTKLYKSNPLKKYLLLLFGLALLIGLCVSTYGVSYKLMSDKLNQSTAEAMIESINDTFFHGIKRINIYEMPNYYYGYYYTGGVINLYCGIDRDVLIHELAHNEQFRYWKANGMKVPYHYPHDGKFYYLEREIYESSQ